MENSNKMMNRESGEVGYFAHLLGEQKPYVIIGENQAIIVRYKKLEELTDEWEEYVPPVSSMIKSVKRDGKNVVITASCRSEAGKIKKRLEALKKLEDNGFVLNQVVSTGPFTYLRALGIKIDEKKLREYKSENPYINSEDMWFEENWTTLMDFLMRKSNC